MHIRLIIKTTQHSNNEDGVFIGMGRIYCGTLTTDSTIYVFDSLKQDFVIIKGFKLFQFMVCVLS